MAFEPLFRSITLRNLLSFGPDTPALELRNLNVLIGPNGSGKSNFVEAFSLLRGCPREVREVIFRGGGVGEWIWKGSPDSPASIDVEVVPNGEVPMRHHLAFRAQQRQYFVLYDEHIVDARSDGQSPPPYLAYHEGQPLSGSAMNGQLFPANTNRSLLAQFRGPAPLEEVSQLAGVYEQISIYRDWALGPSSPLRLPQKTDLVNRPLKDDFSNLGLFLNRLERRREAKDAVRE